MVFDGAKRDRYAWTADLITGAPALYYSTAGTEYVRGNIEASLIRASSEPGLLPGGVPPGREFERGQHDTMFQILSVNYSLYLIIICYDYWMYTGDIALIAKYWSKIAGCLTYIENLVNEDGLVSVEGMEGKKPKVGY